MKRVLLQLFAFTLLQGIGPQVLAVLPDTHPPIVRFSPAIEAYPQNFAIAVDQHNNVFIGNADGLLIFDGESWQLTRLPNREIVRSLDTDPAGRVYVGGFDAFGYVERDQFGRYQYQELSQLYAEQLGGELFADIWGVKVSALGVFFVGLEHLFLYHPESGRVSFWKHEGSFGPVGFFQEKVWLQWRGEGIKAFDGERWQLYPHPDLGRDLLTGLVPMNGDLIVVNAEDRWSRFDGQTFVAMEETRDVPFNASATFAFPASSHSVGFATQLGQVIFFDLETGMSETVNASSGFIPGVAKTESGQLLVVDDLGFASIDWPARWRMINSDSGLVGSISAIKAYKGETYVLSSSGIFAKSEASNRFGRLAWTDHEAWDLLETEDGDLLFADSYEIKQIRPSGEIRVVDNNTTVRLFKQSQFHPGVVFAGTEYGLQVLQKQGLDWQVITTIDDLGSLTISQIVETSPDELWLGSMRGGLHRIRINEIGGETEAMKVTSETGIIASDLAQGAYVYDIDGEVIATTDLGTFRYNGEKFEKFNFEGLDALLVPGRTVELAQTGARLWAFYFDRLFRLGEFWNEENIAGLLRGGISVLDTLDHQVLLGGLGSILTFDGTVDVGTGQSPAVFLTRASVTESGDAARQSDLALDDVRFSSAIKRLTLHFSLMEFQQPEQVRFRARLLPVEHNFSDWTESGRQSFVDLGVGEYELHVEARNSRGIISRVEVPITVQPQWYETMMFTVIAVSLLLVVSFFSMRLLGDRQSRVLKRERDLLELKVAERTRELQSANQQLDRMAHLDGLTQIPNRRKLDSYIEDVRVQCVERSRVMGIALIDVDHFKAYNDTYGHQAGDDLLVQLARLLSRNLRRAEDLVARYGGEEFLVVLPGAELESAKKVVDDMRRNVESSSLKVTISAGLHVQTPIEGTSVDDMIALADKALYQAKERGRNRIEVE